VRTGLRIIAKSDAGAMTAIAPLVTGVTDGLGKAAA
jgi:hypothetical protein